MKAWKGFGDVIAELCAGAVKQSPSFLLLQWTFGPTRIAPSSICHTSSPSGGDGREQLYAMGRTVPRVIASFVYSPFNMNEPCGSKYDGSSGRSYCDSCHLAVTAGRSERENRG